MKSKFVYAVETSNDMQKISRKCYRDNRNNLLKSIDFRTKMIKSLNEEIVVVFSYKSNDCFLRLYKVLKSSIRE